jgi:carbonic anhydrase
MMDSDPLVLASRAARMRHFDENRQLFATLNSTGQSPQILFLGCNDSRVIPEAILGAKPGDLFVLRSIANVVPPYGIGERAVGATLEYAVNHLAVKHILLCGHTDCGIVKVLDAGLGSLGALNEPDLARWIEYARPAQTRVDAYGIDAESRHRAIVEQNVLLQQENLCTYDVVRKALSAGTLELHAWVYDVFTGRISVWDSDSERFVDEGVEETTA